MNFPHSETDWTEAFIRGRLSFDQGMSHLLNEGACMLPDDPPAGLNRETVSRGYDAFERWLVDLLRREPPGEEIVALYFGLFESEESLQPYVCGSSWWDAEDEDWPCDPAWFPEGRYPAIPVYRELYRVLKRDVWAGVYLASGVTALYVVRFAREHGKRMLGNRDRLMLAAGFDDGDVHHIGWLSSHGLNPLTEM